MLSIATSKSINGIIYAHTTVRYVYRIFRLPSMNNFNAMYEDLWQTISQSATGKQEVTPKFADPSGTVCIDNSSCEAAKGSGAFMK